MAFDDITMSQLFIFKERQMFTESDEHPRHCTLGAITILKLVHHKLSATICTCWKSNYENRTLYLHNVHAIVWQLLFIMNSVVVVLGAYLLTVWLAQDLKPSRWRLSSSELWFHVELWQDTSISDVHTASIFINGFCQHPAYRQKDMMSSVTQKKVATRYMDVVAVNQKTNQHIDSNLP